MKILVVLAIVLLMPTAQAFAESGENSTAFEEAIERLIRDYYAAERAAATQELRERTVKRRHQAGNDYDESLGKGAAKLKQLAMRGRSGYAPDIPRGHMPPPGRCRVWLPDTPPGRQPQATSCSRVFDGLPAGAVVLYGGPREDRDVLPSGLGDILPEDLLRALGLSRSDAELLLVGDDVYLVDPSSRTILDVLDDVLLPE